MAVADKKLSSLSIFFPCYNDSHTIVGLVETAYKIGLKVAKQLEVIVVDDGSTDSSRELLKRAQKKYPDLKLVFHKENKGYGGALRSGFKAATNEFVFYTDGDGQYDVKDLVKLAKAINNKIDVVNGVKIERHDPWWRTLAGELYYFWARALFRIPIREVDTDFRLIRKEVLDKIKLEMDSGSICVELIKRLTLEGARFKEVPVHHYYRQFGSSQFFNLGRIFKTLFDDMRLLWQTRNK